MQCVAGQSQRVGQGAGGGQQRGDGYHMGSWDRSTPRQSDGRLENRRKWQPVEREASSRFFGVFLQAFHI